MLAGDAVTLDDGANPPSNSLPDRDARGDVESISICKVPVSVAFPALITIEVPSSPNHRSKSAEISAAPGVRLRGQ